MLELFHLSPALLALVITTGFLTAVLHGATGMAGGTVMTAVLSLIIGVKAAIPAMTVALIISHATRVLLNLSDVDFALALRVLLFSIPGIALGALLFSKLSELAVALIMAGFLVASFPIKRYSKGHSLEVNNKILAGGSAAWGVLAGNVVGPGFVLAPFLLAVVRNRHTFVATLALIVLIMNCVKTGVFGATELLDQSLLLLGLVIGLATIPGNWLGRVILHHMSDRSHSRAIDVMTLIVILNYLYIAFRAIQ